MPSFLCISIRFLQPDFHGRGEVEEPEWPPSPLRLMQALVAAAAGRWNEPKMIEHAVPALRWLEALPASRIKAAHAVPAQQPYRLYVPDNVADKVAAAWARGREASIADYRAEKDVRPVRLDDEAVHYLYPLDDGGCPHLDTLVKAARAITHLGWGTDVAVGDARIVTHEEAARLSGELWLPSSIGAVRLRTPKPGSLDDMMRRHGDFLGRLTPDGFRPVAPLEVFDMTSYRRPGQPLRRAYRVFQLRTEDGAWFRYPHARLIHIAGMVRHQAKKAMLFDPPPGIDDVDAWVDRYVLGHRRGDDEGEGAAHRQLSYVPLPSIGHTHTDPGVRRVLISAPPGDDSLLEHLARRLDGVQLEPLPNTHLPEQPVLVCARYDGVARLYTEPTAAWHSFTPVILPGHDDHNPAKTRKLIRKALAQSGIEEPCDFDWSAFSRFPRAYSAHKYGRDGKPQGYIRPDHLLSQTAVHLTLRFRDDAGVPGPLAVGAGRHCGLGVLAALPGADVDQGEPAAGDRAAD